MELAETQVKGYRALNGVGKLAEVEYDIILSGKKNEVLVLDSINANTALMCCMRCSNLTKGK